MHYDETVYQSHYGWMIGALAVILIAFCSIVPTFYGWWHLGRSVSLSPIETAKAFEAPLLRRADPNGTAHDICVQLGSAYVQYGASLPLDAEDHYDADGERDIGGQCGAGDQPDAGGQCDGEAQRDADAQHNVNDQAKDSSAVKMSDSSATAFARSRLHFGTEGTVSRPLHGQTFSTDEPEMLNDHRESAYSGLTYVNPT